LRIDGRFVEVYERTRQAIRTFTRADARLRVARAEIDAARGHGEGLFTGTDVGPYRVGRLLGRGMISEVYAAERSGERVALKLVRADHLADPAAQQRFERDSARLMRVVGPYCARVLDVGRDGELPYLAMEHVEGRSLALMLREREIDPPEIVGIVSDVSQGLRDIHAAGLLHLDLKPSNIVHAETGRGRRWLIIDFGMSLLGDERRLAGTPQYIAPELVFDELVDPRADLYSLSLILYRLVTGRPAFVGDDRRLIARLARELGPPDPRAFSALSVDLLIALRIGLAPHPDDRFATADELRTTFLAALTGRLDERTRARGHELLARSPWRNT
jgi:serine/threonine-protein kinase